MSIRLLSHADTLHDIGDDVESLYWVLVHQIVKRFVLPHQYVAKDLFDEQALDQSGRPIGGASKQVAITHGELEQLRLSSKPLEALLHECSHCWNVFYRAFRPVRETITEEGKKMLVTALTPSYWLSHFASILHNDDLWNDASERETRDYPRTTGPFRLSGAGKKRKASDAGIEPQETPQPLRRSKRLRRRHQS